MSHQRVFRLGSGGPCLRGLFSPKRRTSEDRGMANSFLDRLLGALGAEPEPDSQPGFQEQAVSSYLGIRPQDLQPFREGIKQLAWAITPGSSVVDAYQNDQDIGAMQTRLDQLYAKMNAGELKDQDEKRELFQLEQGIPQMERQRNQNLLFGALDAKDLAAGAALAGGLAHTVYHGTPHKWAAEEGFSAGRPLLEKIGTGEGAQAYGHGIYFAESPGVAQQYRNQLAEAPKYRQMIVDGVPENDALRAAIERGEDTTGMSNAIYYGRLFKDPAYGLEQAKKWDPVAAEFLRTHQVDYIPDTPQGGATYTLDLPDEVLPRLLDWDKPLSEQAEAVRAALVSHPAVAAQIERAEAQRQLLNAREPKRLEALKGIADVPYGPERMTGQQAITAMRQAGVTPEDVLAAAQVPGLSYLDATSRGAGEGTHNFVIWDQDVLNRTVPLEINGEPTGLKPGDYPLVRALLGE